jgi:hypothetical protein
MNTKSMDVCRRLVSHEKPNCPTSAQLPGNFMAHRLHGAHTSWHVQGAHLAVLDADLFVVIELCHALDLGECHQLAILYQQR